MAEETPSEIIARAMRPIVEAELERRDPLPMVPSARDRRGNAPHMIYGPPTHELFAHNDRIIEALITDAYRDGWNAAQARIAAAIRALAKELGE